MKGLRWTDCLEMTLRFFDTRLVRPRTPTKSIKYDVFGDFKIGPLPGKVKSAMLMHLVLESGNERV